MTSPTESLTLDLPQVSPAAPVESPDTVVPAADGAAVPALDVAHVSAADVETTEAVVSDAPVAEPGPAAETGDDPQPAADAAVPASNMALPKPAAAPQIDCGPLLKKTFPALFAGGPKPLKLRIQTDIQERAPGVFSKQALSSFFRRYTGSTSYLIAVSRARHRYDLDGAEAGELSEEHRKIAADELARRRGNQESRVALEVQQRRNRATLLHDFERTTLTPANFCALKGIAVDELDGYLATARREAAERPLPPPAFDTSRRPPPNRPPQRPPGGGGPRQDARPAPRRRQESR